MSKKYENLGRLPGRCVATEGVNIRIEDVNAQGSGRKLDKSKNVTGHVVILSAEQVPCPEDSFDRCIGCILDCAEKATRHPEWADIASGIIPNN